LAVKCGLESSSHRLYESAGGNARNGLRNSEWGLPISYGKVIPGNFFDSTTRLEGFRA
jgi:hypothetical protein